MTDTTEAPSLQQLIETAYLWATEDRLVKDGWVPQEALLTEHDLPDAGDGLLSFILQESGIFEEGFEGDSMDWETAASRLNEAAKQLSLVAKTVRHFKPEGTRPRGTLSSAQRALQLVSTAPHIVAWLEQNDPKALEQVRNAIVQPIDQAEVLYSECVECGDNADDIDGSDGLCGNCSDTQDSMDDR
jgi:hypothetical protein